MVKVVFKSYLAGSFKPYVSNECEVSTRTDAISYLSMMGFHKTQFKDEYFCKVAFDEDCVATIKEV